MLRSGCVILRVEAGRRTIRAEVETGEAGNPLMCLQSTVATHAASSSSLLPRVHLLLPLLLLHCPVQMTVADMVTLLRITGEQSSAHKAGEAAHLRFRFLFAVPARRMLLTNVRKDRFMRGKIYAAQRAEIGGLFLFLFVFLVGLFGPAATQSVCGGAWQPILFFSFISANAADSALARGPSTTVILPECVVTRYLQPVVYRAVLLLL
jgi:hypothetical protein